MIHIVGKIRTRRKLWITDMRTSLFVLGSVTLTGAAFAQSSLISALEDLAKVEGKAKQGVIAEYSSILLDSNESTYGRIYFKDKLIRIDEIINIKVQARSPNLCSLSESLTILLAIH